MNLYAAFVPPEEISERLAALVGEHAVAARSEPAPGPRTGLFGRRTPQPESPPVAMLDVIAPPEMLVPITDFGSVATGDARRLADTLADVCAGLQVPTVQVHGGEALVGPDDRSVWADLQGSEDDLGALRDVAQAVVAGVEPLGYFRDRRQFKSRMAIATITDATTVEVLEGVLTALKALEFSWTVDEVTLFQRGGPAWQVLPIGS